MYIRTHTLMPVVVVGVGETSDRKTECSFCPCGADILMGINGNNNLHKYINYVVSSHGIGIMGGGNRKGGGTGSVVEGCNFKWVGQGRPSGEGTQSKDV